MCESSILIIKLGVIVYLKELSKEFGYSSKHLGFFFVLFSVVNKKEQILCLVLYCVPTPRPLPLTATVPAQSWACEPNCRDLVVVFVWQRWHLSEPVSRLKENRNLTSNACSQSGAWTFFTLNLWGQNCFGCYTKVSYYSLAHCVEVS